VSYESFGVIAQLRYPTFAMFLAATSVGIDELAPHPILWPKLVLPDQVFELRERNRIVLMQSGMLAIGICP
jgi:hypothetical protein